jgi:4-carboxymuconolactone decarboxylase
MNAQRCYLIIVLLSLAAGVHRVTAQSGVSPPSMETNMPSDIDPQSGFRLPLPRREDLDEAGRIAYDRAITPGRTIAGLQGPAGVQLYSAKIASHVAAINQYLRFEAGFTARTREIAILATAREMDSQFEWVAHEPEALKQGVPQTVIDVIKHRGSTNRWVR